MFYQGSYKLNYLCRAIFARNLFIAKLLFKPTGTQPKNIHVCLGFFIYGFCTILKRNDLGVKLIYLAKFLGHNLWVIVLPIN